MDEVINRTGEKVSYFDLEMTVAILQFYAKVFELKNSAVTAYIQKHLIYLVAALQRITDSVRVNNQLYMLMYNDAIEPKTDTDRNIVNLVSLFYQYVALVGYSYGFEMQL